MAKKKTTPKTTQELNAAIVEAQKKLLSAIKEVKEVSEEEAAAVPVEEIVPENSAVTAELAPVDSSLETAFGQHNLPPAGGVDSLAVLVPATSADLPEKLSPKNSPDISNATNVANEEEIQQLEREIDAKATEIIGQFTERIEYELLPLLYRMKGLLPHGEWGNWFKRFRKRVRFQWTMRTVQRKFKELEDGWNDYPADDANNDNEPGDEGQEESEDASTPAAVCESPKELLTKWIERQRKTLSGGDGPVDADPIRDGERRVDTSLQMLDELKLAVDEGLLDGVEAATPVSKGSLQAAEGVYKLLAPLLYSYYLRDTFTRWNAAVKAKETTGEEIPEDVRVAYYENFIVRNRKYAPYPEILNVPWPTLKVDDTLPISTRLARGIGPPMWLCIKEPNGDTIECFIDRAGSGKCERVRRVKVEDIATTNDESNLDFPFVYDDAAKDEAVSEMSSEPEQIASAKTDAQREATAAIDVSKPAAAGQTLVTIEPAPESIGLPGCTYIYAPSGQANEFAPLAANPYKGCGHGCTYCYNTTRKNPEQKATFHDGAVPKKDYLTLLLKDAKKYQAAGITGQVTLCFSTDAYNPFDTSLTRPTLEIIQQHGMGICVLTKGGTRALADIDLYRPDRDCFASTLTGLDEAFVSKWEPNAASPDDRIAALKAFNKKGIFTWVSLEPTLNVEASLSVVEATHGFVNLYKIGKVNYCKEISDTIDWRDYTLRMIDLCKRLGVKHYIKRDLQQYLPVGYHNPMRVVQHC
jgi:hypothetical protein